MLCTDDEVRIQRSRGARIRSLPGVTGALQVRVISAHGRITGWVLSCLPTALGLFFCFLNPEKYASFYRDPLGMQMIAGALFLQLIGVLLIKKIVTLEY